MKTLRLLIPFLITATCALAETSAPSAEAVFLCELIEHPATRALVLSKLDPLPPESVGLPQRAGMRVMPDTRAYEDKSAQHVVFDIRGRIAGVIEMTSHLSDKSLIPQVEKLLAITHGLAPNPPKTSRQALYELIGLHQRKLSLELLKRRHLSYWDPIDIRTTNGQYETHLIYDQFRTGDLPLVADLICDQLDDYDYSLEFGPLTRAQYAASEPLVRCLCAALGIKYSVPFGGWTPGNLKGYAIKQLRRAAKRPNLAPADAKAIVDAIHQLETFQPDPMNKLHL
jgi:hypothetical protein